MRIVSSFSNEEDTQVYLCAAKEDCVINLKEQLKRIMLQDEKFAYMEHEV